MNVEKLFSFFHSFTYSYINNNFYVPTCMPVCFYTIVIAIADYLNEHISWLLPDIFTEWIADFYWLKTKLRSNRSGNDSNCSCFFESDCISVYALFAMIVKNLKRMEITKKKWSINRIKTSKNCEFAGIGNKNPLK